jgi:hypothetical protein
MRNKETATKILLFSLSLFLIYACAAPQKHIEEPADSEAISIINKLTAEGHSPNGMQALADIDISAYGRKYSMRLALVLKKPRHLRAESIPIIGTPDFFITLNDREMKAYLPHEGEFYIGKPSSANLGKFIPLKLPVDDLASLLMGAVPTIEKRTKWRMGSKEEGVFRLDGMGSAGKISSIWIDPVKNRILKTVLFDAGKDPLFTFFYRDFSEGDKTLPRQIQVVLEQNESRLTIHYRDIDYSIEETEKLFDLAVPPAAQTIYLD